MLSQIKERFRAAGKNSPIYTDNQSLTRFRNQPLARFHQSFPVICPHYFKDYPLCNPPGTASVLTDV